MYLAKDQSTGDSSMVEYELLPIFVSPFGVMFAIDINFAQVLDDLGSLTFSILQTCVDFLNTYLQGFCIIRCYR